jgi:hypothetical protein
MSNEALSDQQRRGLCEVMYWAFVELRGMGSAEHAVQASKLCYALHNLPHFLFAEDFTWDKVKGPLRYYQEHFYRERKTGYDYVRMVDQARKGETVSP